VRSFDLKPAVIALARSRLAQFFAIGLVGWALSPTARRSRDVMVDASAVAEGLRLEQGRVARPLTDEDKQRVMGDLVADEVLLREGLRLGVGTEDAVVRGRIADRMRAHLEAASPVPVTADEARAEAARQSARMPVRVRLAVAFVGKDRPNATGDADALARALASAPETPSPYGGDRPPLEAGAWWREEDLARIAGPSVARAALETAVGAWSAPIASAWGFYLVRPVERRPPTAEEAMEAGAAEVRRQKRAAAVARAIGRVLSDYDVTVRSPAGEPPFDRERAATASGRAGGDGVD
jgi:hypothetical protein